MSDLVGNPEDWFSHVAAQFTKYPHFCVYFTSRCIKAGQNRRETVSHGGWN